MPPVLPFLCLQVSQKNLSFGGNAIELKHAHAKPFTSCSRRESFPGHAAGVVVGVFARVGGDLT